MCNSKGELWANKHSIQLFNELHTTTLSETEHTTPLSDWLRDRAVKRPTTHNPAQPTRRPARKKLTRGFSFSRCQNNTLFFFGFPHAALTTLANFTTATLLTLRDLDWLRPRLTTTRATNYGQIRGHLLWHSRVGMWLLGMWSFLCWRSCVAPWSFLVVLPPSRFLIVPSSLQ